MAFFGKIKQETIKLAAPQVFSILLSEKTVQALFWQVTEGMIEIVSQSGLKYFFDDNDCLIKLDECLQELGPESEKVSQALFHLDCALSDQAGLLPEKTDFLKHLTNTLSLESIGVAANIEALAQIISHDVPKPYNLIIEFTADKEGWTLVNNEEIIWSSETFKNDDLQFTYEQKWIELKKVIADERIPEEILSILYVSSLYNRSELLNKSELFPMVGIESEFIGSAEILEKVVPPSAVALSRERGWIEPEIIGESEMSADSGEKIPAPSQIENEIAFDEDEYEAATSINRRSKKKNLILMIVAGVIAGLIVTMLILYIVLGMKTVATITISPKQIPLQKNTIITVDPKLKTSDFEKLVLAGTLSKEDQTGKSSIVTTGKKKVGDKAVGKIKIQNKELTSDKKFEKGLILEAESGEKFVLNENTTVGGAKRDEKDGEVKYEITEKEAEVTAINVGEEGNLKADVKLKIAGYSTNEFEAKSASAFTGGKSSEVKVVTETDQKNLQNELNEKILAQTIADLKLKQSGGKYYIPLVKSAVPKSKTWSTQLDEEADGLELEMIISLPIVSYDGADLKPLAQAVLYQELPAGYALAAAEPQLMSAANNEQKEGEPVKLQVNVSSFAIAEIGTGDINEQIAGLAEAIAESKIKTNNGVNTVSIEYNNSFYKKFYKKLPKNSSQIVVKINNPQ